MMKYCAKYYRLATLGVFVVLLAVVCAPCYCASPEPSGFFRSPIDPKAERMPRKFKGHSVRELDSALSERLYVEKLDDFELRKFNTAEEIESIKKSYKREGEEKRRKLSKAMFLDNIMIGDYVSIVFPPEKAVQNANRDLTRQYIRSKYYPNSSAIELFISFKSEGALGYPIILSGKTSTNLYKETEYAVLPQEIERRPHQLISLGVFFKASRKGSDYNGVWRLKNVPDELVKRIDSIAVACVGKFAAPSIELFDYFDHIDQLPDDSHYYQNERSVYVYLENVSFWVYDYETGKIYARISANAMRQGTTTSL